VALDDMLCEVEEMLMGVDLYGVCIRLFAFADDVAVVISSQDELDSVLGYWKSMECRTGLVLNMDKTEFLPFRGNSVVWQGVRSVEHFTYLGIYLDRGGNVVFSKVLDKFWQRVEIFASSHMSVGPVRWIVSCFNSYCASVLLYYLRCDCDVGLLLDEYVAAVWS